MVTRLDALTILSSEPEVLAGFWGSLLGWRREDTDLLPDEDAPLVLRFVEDDQPRFRLNQIHFHLTSNSASQAGTVDRALALGATHLDVGQLPEEGHVVLADPDGNEFCVIEAGNDWLAGTGLLGELAADGTREVGVFWSAALDWRLVHDEDGETAIEPPGGGFKIAWGGPPLNERAPRNRMHFQLVTDDLDAEVVRLGELGGREVTRREGAVEMEDPDGNEFSLRSQ